MKTFAICGPGRVGETQVASEFVLSHKEDFEAMFWLHGDVPAKMAEEFGHIAVELGLVTADSAEARDQAIPRDLVKGWLANPLKPSDPQGTSSQDASWLLVFDNGDNPDVLDDFWPVNGTGSVVVTSRDPLAKTNAYYGTLGIDLKPFSTGDATDFLMQLTEFQGQSKEQEAALVADRLGGFPLAIT